MKLKASTLVGLALLTPAFLVIRAVGSQAVMQQSTATTRSGFVVILIPDFPIESIVYGLMLGLAILVFVRKRS